MRRRFIMKIGILGSGDVGRRLADGFIELGHTVKIGSRNPNQEKITEWIAKHNTEKVSSGTFAETASFGSKWYSDIVFEDKKPRMLTDIFPQPKAREIIMGIA
jgi:pyrroline-5-carboxylate reductase